MCVCVCRDGYQNPVLNGPQAKLFISSDVNGSAVGPGEIKKIHIHLLLLYRHYLANSITPESPAVSIWYNIRTFSMKHFCYSQFRKKFTLTRRSYRAHNMKALFNCDDRGEN